MFGYGFDRRSIYIVLAVFLALTLVNLGTFNIVTTLLTLPGVILALSFHEFAHAFVAVKLGDPTPKNQGRLTIDPLAHIDPVGIFLLIFAHLGWGKPVQINPNNFSRVSRGTGEVLVALAGPLMNFILAFVLMVIYYATVFFIPGTGIIKSLSALNVLSIVMTMLYYAIVVNVGLGVFNLIPIPPLDGSKVFLRLLPYRAQSWINDNMQIISMVFLILFITGLLSQITAPIISAIIYGMDYILTAIFSIFIWSAKVYEVKVRECSDA